MEQFKHAVILNKPCGYLIRKTYSYSVKYNLYNNRYLV